MFFGVLIAGLALAIGIAIYDLVVRELALSQISTQSQLAVFAADTGADCALYWDAKYTGPKPFFPAPWIVGWVAPSGSAYTCNQQNIATQLVAANIVQNATDATTTFRMSMSPTSVEAAPCTVVSVHKYTDSGSGTPIRRTTISADGYNTCNTLAPNRLQRSLIVFY